MPNKDRILIKNVSVPTDDMKRFESKDVLLDVIDDNYVISEIGSRIETSEAKTVDGFGLTAMPAFIDLWSRMGEPDGEKRESFSTGTNAAVNGGYGTVCVAPFGKPATDSPEVIAKRRDDAERNARCGVLFIGALTRGCAGTELCDFAELKDAGAVAFSDGMYESLPDDMLRDAMTAVKKADSLLIVSPRLTRCFVGGSVNLGRVSRLLGLGGIPSSAEVVDIARYIIYAAETGCRLHIAGVSTEQGVEAVYQAKRRGIDVTASAFPYNFSFSEDDILFYGPMAKVWPPLRSASDVMCVRQALTDGTLDCVSSCHVPLTDSEKTRDISTSGFGITGLQTAFAAACSYLYPDTAVDVVRLCQLFSSVTAGILGINENRISVGHPAKFNLFDLDRDYIVSENLLKSRSGNSIFKGLTLRGSVRRSFVGT